jgi:hypothetical protein
MEQAELIDIEYIEKCCSVLKSNTEPDDRVEAIINMMYITERLAGKYGIKR